MRRSTGDCHSEWSMDLRSTHKDESRKRGRPRVSGDPRPVDSRFRGNDVVGVIFRRAKRGISLGLSLSIPRNQSEVPRFARNDTAR
jgi:hypothetical protein